MQIVLLISLNSAYHSFRSLSHFLCGCLSHIRKRVCTHTHTPLHCNMTESRQEGRLDYIIQHLSCTNTPLFSLFFVSFFFFLDVRALLSLDVRSSDGAPLYRPSLGAAVVRGYWSATAPSVSSSAQQQQQQAAAVNRQPSVLGGAKNIFILAAPPHLHNPTRGFEQFIYIRLPVYCGTHCSTSCLNWKPLWIR